jgi:peptidyl-prolyl cis-trans isomerase B (cyclophilin B)
MKTFILTCLLGLLTAGILQAQDKTNSTAAPATAADDKEVAVIKTSAGEMVIEFWTDAAPKTIENFKKLAKSGFYDGTCFHRIIKDFMIQGGDPDSKNTNAPPGSFGGGGPGYNIKAEFNDHPHVRGVISMARSRDPDSAGSQFFICLGPTAQLDHQYTTFGKLIKGDEVLGRLGDSPCTGPNSMGEYSIPKPRVDLISIKIVKASSLK